MDQAQTPYQKFRSQFHQSEQRKIKSNSASKQSKH
jgi:hypothetical protein